ncbi:MAG: DUF3072 domain-containing protein [Thermoleophilaceae bacterium]
MRQKTNQAARPTPPPTRPRLRRRRRRPDRRRRPAQSPAAEKDPGDWVTGEEPMTAPQASYLQTLCQEAGEEFDDSISKAEASRRIDALQSKTGRGTD